MARRFVPAAVRRLFFGPSAPVSKMDWRTCLRARSTFQSLSYDPVEGYFETMSISGDDSQDSFDGLKSALNGYSTLDVSTVTTMMPQRATRFPDTVSGYQDVSDR